MDHVDGVQAVALAEQPVVGCGNAAALGVAQADRAGLITGSLLDLIGQLLADTSQARMAEGVQIGRFVDHLPNIWQVAALSHHHHSIMLVVVVVVLEQRTDMVDVYVLLGDQNHVRAAGHAGGVGDPAGIAAHHLDHHHAVVRIGGGMDAVDSLGGNHYGGVEAEGLVGAVDVVVNGLGHAYAGYAVLAQVEVHRLRVVAAQRNQRIDLVGLQNLLHLFDAAGNLLHVGARRVQDGAALQLDAVNILQSEGNELVVQHTAPAVEKADELIAIVVDALPHGRINHRIQSGAVAAAGQQSNSHRKNLLIEGAAAEAVPGIWL